jgi:hypothetical protein
MQNYNISHKGAKNSLISSKNFSGKEERAAMWVNKILLAKI